MSAYAARAATAPELVKLRSDGQASIPELAINKPATVYTALVNGVPTSVDGIASIAYDGGSGTLADVLEGMTLYLGTSAGARDVGICRIRKAPTADTFYINQSSDVIVTDNQYITVVNEYGLWQRDIASIGGVIKMDYDITFAAGLGGAIPRVAPLVAVLELVATTIEEVTTYNVDFTPPSPALSACYDGASIVSYLYVADGASATADMNTDHPSWSYDTAGEYKWSCAITDDEDRTVITHRTIHVNPPAIDFELSDCSGSYDDGYWTFEVTCYNGVDLADVTDRAMVTLYSNDYYGGARSSIGKIAGYENILATGWIDGESIVQSSEFGTVSFTVKGAGFWFDKLRAFPFELQDTATPTTWKQITELTVDKALAHILFWTTTAPLMMDCFFTGNTTRISILTQPSGSLWEQINSIALNTVFAAPLVNSYGQMYIETDAQIVDSTTRAAIPVVMDITTADRSDELDLERIPNSSTSMIELSALSEYTGLTSPIVYSRAPGNTPKTLGEYGGYDDYIVSNQDECNRIAGCLLAIDNNEFDQIDITLPSINKLFDIAPRMYATLTTSATDNPRGVVLTAKRMIPRDVRYDFEDGVLTTGVTFEAEAVGVDGVTYVPPPVAQNNLANPIGDIGFVDFPVGDLFPSLIPLPLPSDGCTSARQNEYYAYWDKASISTTDIIRTARCYFPCKLHAGAGIYKSKVSGAFGISCRVFAFVGSERVAAAGEDGVFHLATEIDVDGFEIELDGRTGSLFFTGGYHAPGTTVTTELLAPNKIKLSVIQDVASIFASEVILHCYDALHRASAIGLKQYMGVLMQATPTNGRDQNVFLMNTSTSVTGTPGGAEVFNWYSNGFYITPPSHNIWGAEPFYLRYLSNGGNADGVPLHHNYTAWITLAEDGALLGTYTINLGIAKIENVCPRG